MARAAGHCRRTPSPAPAAATRPPFRDAELYAAIEVEVWRQDTKHGPYGVQGGTPLGRSRLAIATLEDEVREVLQAWRDERRAPHWNETRIEVVQVAAVCIRALRVALP